MDDSEKDLRKHFEQVTTRNVTAAIDFGNKTREIVRSMEVKLDLFKKQLDIQQEQLNQFKLQLLHLQQKVFSGGTK